MENTVEQNTNDREPADTDVAIASPQFKVITERIEETKGTDKKYVLYTLQLRHHTVTNIDDPNPAYLERRYTDFSNLYTLLRDEHADVMASVNFPRKVLTGNFDNKLISARSKSFEDMLQHILSIGKLRQSRAFLNFLQDIEMKKVREYLNEKDYMPALALLENNFRLLNKVYTDRTPAVLFALCRVLGCCVLAVPEVSETKKWAELALRRYDGVSDSDLLELYIPILTICGEKLEESKNVIQERLSNFKKRGVKFNSSITLLEAVDDLEKRLFKVD